MDKGRQITIRIIEPAGTAHAELLRKNITDLENRGFAVHYQANSIDDRWPYTSTGLEQRAEALNHALLETDTDFIIAARGGYGMSDLLPHIEWDDLKQLQAKCVIGLSDISALHSSLYAQLGWHSLHASMPGGELWQPSHDDTDSLITYLTNDLPWQCEIEIEPIISQSTPQQLAGKLFGGCFSVLTNLIGTPYLPSKLQDHILFFEDIGEPAQRLMRCWNQWNQSGLLAGVKGVVFGSLLGADAQPLTTRDLLLTEISRRSTCPIFYTNCFGHSQPNFPLGIGAETIIEKNQLQWTLSEI